MANKVQRFTTLAALGLGGYAAWAAPAASPPAATSTPVTKTANAGAAPVITERLINRDLANDWTVTGTADAARDTNLKADVLTATKSNWTLEGKTPDTGPREIRALIRLRTDVAAGAHADFNFAKKDAKDPGLRFYMQAGRGHNNVYCQFDYQGKPLHDIKAIGQQQDWNPTFANGYSYQLRSYPNILPGWPEEYRVGIEKAMAALPDHDTKWLEMRVELRPGHFRMYLDDRLVAIKSGTDLNIDGLSRVMLSPGVQLAAYEVRPLSGPATTNGFLPLRLGGYNNERQFLGATVQPASFAAIKNSRIGDVPFVFTGTNLEGNDHIDVGQSLLRQANTAGYLPTNEPTSPRFIGSRMRDPARIQVRVPFAQYDALYVLAAADGAKDSIPLVSVSFFRPDAGFAQSTESNVPLATATGKVAGGSPVAVTLSNGKKVNLWLVKIPISPEAMTSFSDLDIVEFEITKKIYQYRSYPDPISYGFHPGGQESGVHIYAATLHEAPIGYELKADHFGHVWTAPEVPSYTASLQNRSAKAQSGTLTVTTRSHDGTESTKQLKSVTLAPNSKQTVRFDVPVKLNGYHDIRVALKAGDIDWSEKRAFVRLATDTRSTRWTEGKGSLFGYWSYNGGHHTPHGNHSGTLMTLAGARTSISWPADGKDNPLLKKHWTGVAAGAWEVQPQGWAAEEPVDKAKYDAYKKEVIERFHKVRDPIPDEYKPDHVFFFPEPHVSLRLTAGNYPEYWQGEPHVYTEEEKRNIRMFTVTAKAAAEAIREKWPHLKILIPWGDPLFSVPLLRSGFPKELIDGSGIDIAGFERLPEMQLHQISPHRMYQLKHEYEKAGIPNPRFYFCEGIFVPTEPGAATYREQMDIYNRQTILAMGYGARRFYTCWFSFDAASYYGAEHYACSGTFRRIPYADPKPSYAAYAAMTRNLNEAEFDAWIPTGSQTTYALRFKGPKGNIYPLWTVRGKRGVTLMLNGGGTATVTDAMDNAKQYPSANGQVTIPTDQSVVYVTGVDVASVKLVDADHTDAKPAVGATQVADLGDGNWKYTSERNLDYENNSFAITRYPGRFSAATATDAKQGKVMVSTLEKQDTVHELMPWYNVLKPAKPITLAGAPSHLGLWVKGNSDWGRFIYRLKDAKGEVWTSIGAKDDWNCDDVHSWSSFNFDGWRYLRFELPGHLGWDNYRRIGTTWWRSDNGDGVVDLPLQIENIIVEQRTHIIYVNDVQPVPGNQVSFGKMMVEYEKPFDATPEAVRLSKLRMPLPKGNFDLPNPIKEMETAGTGEPTKILKLRQPTHYYDGTRIHVDFTEVPDAKAHYIWVSAHADGRGAINMTPGGAKSGLLVTGLRPAIKLSFWVVYQTADGKMSKPSPVHTEVLVDEFKEK